MVILCGSLLQDSSGDKLHHNKNGDYMGKKNELYKTIRTVAVVILMLLQGGDVPKGDNPKGTEYGPVRPVERLICQPEVTPLQR